MPKKREVPIDFCQTRKEIIKIFSVLLLILFLFCLFNSFFGIFEKNVCGDGTHYNECSKTQPYFCSKGVLIQEASLCECQESFIRNGSVCENKYQTSPKSIRLNYVLNGNYGHIDFLVYKGMVDYLKEHPQSSFYFKNENYSLSDFKLRIIEESEQKKLLIPLVINIQNLAKNKEDQARIAISLVQKIPYEENSLVGNANPSLWPLKYPYDVLYRKEGLCGSKSDLLAFLLKEIGYEVIIFHYYSENHEAIGIKCPKRYSLNNTGYCFVESTQPAIISYNEGEYSEQGKLYSVPEIIEISKGISLGGNMEEYRDARILNRIYTASKEHEGKINWMEYFKLKQITEKYGLIF
jgi:hypothetical protein